MLFFPGDRGRKDDKGRLYISGRDTLFINVQGNKVDPEEVEAVLGSDPRVEEVVVLGVPGGRGDELVKAAVVLRSDCSETELVELCRARLADYKVPRLIEFREEIPRSPLGKILRKYLT